MTGNSTMKLISVNVGLPREAEFKGHIVKTGIFKEPVQGRITLRKLNLDGDRQADLTVHGGEEKAVYAYASEHYEYWRHELPGTELPWGMFGENFTTEGLLEYTVNIGDRFRIGSAELMVTQPRMPCYKLGVKFGRGDIIRRFMESGRSGIYFKVLQEGEVGTGDVIELINRDKNNITVKDILRMFVHDEEDVEKMKIASRVEALPEGWRNQFRQQVHELESK